MGKKKFCLQPLRFRDLQPPALPGGHRANSKRPRGPQPVTLQCSTLVGGNVGSVHMTRWLAGHDRVAMWPWPGADICGQCGQCGHWFSIARQMGGCEHSWVFLPLLIATLQNLSNLQGLIILCPHCPQTRIFTLKPCGQNPHRRSLTIKPQSRHTITPHNRRSKYVGV